jgi:TPR repeat protein
MVRKVLCLCSNSICVDVLSIVRYGKAAAAGNEYARERLVNLLSRTEVPVLIKAYSGDADAMFEVGQKWESGLLYPQSARKAAEFYERAVVLKKHVGAANALALMFVKGTGVSVDTSRAFKLWQVAADAGHPEAMYHIGTTNQAHPANFPEKSWFFIVFEIDRCVVQQGINHH